MQHVCVHNAIDEMTLINILKQPINMKGLASYDDVMFLTSFVIVRYLFIIHNNIWIE